MSVQTVAMRDLYPQGEFYQQQVQKGNGTASPSRAGQPAVPCSRPALTDASSSVTATHKSLSPNGQKGLRNCVANRSLDS